MVDGAERPGRKRSGLAAETSVSAEGVGTSSAASVRVLAFGEGARGLDEHGHGRELLSAMGIVPVADVVWTPSSAPLHVRSRAVGPGPNRFPLTTLPP